jgi:hypothetical protein
MALDDTSTHNATRKKIKNSESMMTMQTKPGSAVGIEIIPPEEKDRAIYK